ncbi:MAG TPA: hypothetical protein VMC85_12345 [Desulfomonilaceae bacterium]|nr:hypothetical protein [Desulfomonilaceae bacterium]
MWNAADVENKAANNSLLLSSCGVAYGATSVKARANEIDMIMVSATAVPSTELTESL